jgi:hypothetical protein
MIVDHPRHKIDAPAPLYEEPAQVVQCDFCERLAEHSGRDAGEAAEAARLEGFKLVGGVTLSAAKKWQCGPCGKLIRDFLKS